MNNDDKDLNSMKNGQPINIDIELEVDPSSIELESDGSVSEPSFSSDVSLSDGDKSDSSADSKEEPADDKDLKEDSEDDKSDTPDKEDASNDSDDFETLDEDDDSDEEELEPGDEEETTRESSKEEKNESSLEESKEENEEPAEEVDDKSSDVVEDTDSTPEKEEPVEDSKDNDVQEDTSSKDDNVGEVEEEKTSDTIDDGKEEPVDDKDLKEDSKDIEDTKDTGDSKEKVDSKDVDDSSKSEPVKDDSSTKESADNKGKESTDKKEDSGKGDSKDSKGDKGSKDKPDAKDAADKAKDKANDAKDAAKDKAKDAADAAKDKAKDVADAAKDKAKDAVKDKAADAAKNAGGAKNPANLAKNAKDLKDVAKDPKKMGHVGIRAFAELPNPYSKATKAVLAVMDGLMGSAKVNEILDKVGMKAIKAAIASMIMGAISAMLPFFLLILMIYMAFAPLLENIEKFDEAARKAANTVEKFKNLYINHNFGDSKEVFWEEIDRLDKIYGDELDETLLLSTVFYPDIKSGYQTRYDNISEIIQDVGFDDVDATTEDRDKSITMFTAVVQKEIESLLLESDSTYDPATGLSYSTGKIYRLRNLAEHMFASSFLGDESEYSYETISLKDWLDRYSDYFGVLLHQMLRDITISLANAGLGFLASNALLVGGTTLVSVGMPITGTIATIAGLVAAAFTAKQAYDDFKTFTKDLKLLINCFFMGYMSIKSITISGSLDDGDFSIDEDAEESDKNAKFDSILEKIEVKYYKYKYSEENYKRYLREIYIPNSPEFEPYLTYDADGKPTGASIESIINDIYEYKYYFEKLFYIEEEDDSESYSKFCLGAIDRKLSSAMSMPVDVPDGRCVEFLGNNAYGYTSSGVLHNGVELNEQSTGNVEGDKVYSVMDGGTVKASSFDSTMECTGGCLEIEYKYSSTVGSASTYTYSIVYKGLSASSVTLSKGDTVTDRQEIGTIGKAEESENVGMPSLYLEFRTSDGSAIDPTNMVVKCNSVGLEDYPGATVKDVPQSFNQGTGYTATCLLPEGFDWGCDNAGDIYVGTDADVYPVYTAWVDQGAKYSNGLAVITVDGVDRYFIATVNTFGVPGDVVNIKLENGEIIPAVLFDEKSLKDENIFYVDDVPWGHDSGGYISVIEFEAHTDSYNSYGPSVNSSSGYDIPWDSSSPVVSFSNNGNILTGSFDLASASSGVVTGGGGLQLCDTMYSGGQINNYVNKAIELSNSYSTTSSASFTISDSASYVYHVLVNSGIIPSTISGFTTDSMGEILKEYSFSRSDYDASKLVKGDIVIDHDAGSDGLVIIYLGDDKQISATNESGSIVISIKTFVDDSRYHDIYRYNGY